MNRSWTILALCFWMTRQMLLASAGLETCDPGKQTESCCCTVPVEPVSCCVVPVDAGPCSCHFEEAPEQTATVEITPPAPRPRLPLLAVLSPAPDFQDFRASEVVFHALPNVGRSSAQHNCALLQVWRC